MDLKRFSRRAAGASALIFCAVLLCTLLASCAYMPAGDPNHHDLRTHNMRTGGAYEPHPREKDNFNSLLHVFNGDTKFTW